MTFKSFIFRSYIKAQQFLNLCLLQLFSILFKSRSNLLCLVPKNIWQSYILRGFNLYVLFQKASEEKMYKISKKVAGLGENLTNLIININIFYVFICDFFYLHLKNFRKKLSPVSLLQIILKSQTIFGKSIPFFSNLKKKNV